MQVPSRLREAAFLSSARGDILGRQTQKPRPGFPGRGWHCRRDRLLSYLVVNCLAELQRLNNNGLLVVAEATAQTERGRNDNRKSDEHAHGWFPQKFPAESTFDGFVITQRRAGCCALHVTVAVFRTWRALDSKPLELR